MFLVMNNKKEKWYFPDLLEVRHFGIIYMIIRNVS